MMYLEHETVVQIIANYFLDKLTDDDKTILDEWLQTEANRLFFERITAEGFMAEELTRLEYYQNCDELKEEVLWSRINSNEEPEQRKIFSVSRILAVAACVLVTCGVYFFVSRDIRNHETASTNEAANNDTASVMPGSHTATLQQADGNLIALNNTWRGNLANEENVIITVDSGKITYHAETLQYRQAVTSTFYNTLTTARGQTYELVLPDGTHVWLNAASSIRYPVAFTGEERQVVISGEAYFEVAKDSLHPFYVIPDNIVNKRIEVLGTHFNVNTYGDERTIKTTLLEGKIKVRQGNSRQILKPGQQAVISDIISITNNIDTSQVVAWKNGKFNFKNCNLPTVMNQLARWYNVTVEYPANMPTEKFWGTVSRDMQIRDVVPVLDSISRFHFMIEGRRIIIK